MLSTISRTCSLCGKDSSMAVDSASLYLYNQGAMIQDAFPDSTPDERETIKSGIHGKCWDDFFGEVAE
jgi:hypothetical protein